MKFLYKLSLVSLLLAALFLAFPAPVHAQGPDNDGQVIFGGSYTLEDGQSLNGDLAIIGGTAAIREGATVNGSVVVTGGSIEVAGEVNGDVVGVGGSVTLSDTAVVNGNLLSVGANIARAEGAVVNGDVVNGAPGSYSFNLPRNTLQNPVLSAWKSGMRSIGDFLWRSFQVLALAALAALVVLFMPNVTARVTHAISSQTVVSGAMGLLTLIVAPALVLLLAITLVLSPLAILGILALITALIFGWVALGYEVGNRLAAALKVQWAPAVNAGLGTLLTSMVAGLFGLIPCVGWLVGFLGAVVGLGAVITTRFGTQAAAVSPSPTAVVSPAPIPPAEPPVVPSEDDPNI